MHSRRSVLNWGKKPNVSFDSYHILEMTKMYKRRTGRDSVVVPVVAAVVARN